VEVVTGLQGVAERLASGASITDGDVGMLLESRDLIAIGSVADEVRRRLHGARTSFVRVFEVRVDAVPDSLPASLAAGEIRLVGNQPSMAEATAAVAAVRTLSGDIPLTGLSLGDMVRWDVPLEDAARRLRDAGLTAVAEVPIDAFEDPAAVAAVRRAGLEALRLTVHSYGDAPDTLSLVHRAAEFQKRVGGFRAFAPLPRVVSPITPTTGYDDVKLVALARLIVADVPSIQVDWPLYGPKLAQVALTMGADDIDGIAAYEPAILGSRRSALAEITGNIRAAALVPFERNGRFEPLG
jgi:aminodeoxyfutalosine synthase